MGGRVGGRDGRSMCRSRRLVRRTLGWVPLVVLLTLVTLTLAASHTARADGRTASFSLKPVQQDPANPATSSYFVLNAQAGSVLHEQVRVSNTGGARGSAALYGVDATTGQTSGVVYEPKSAPRSDVGAWLTLATQQVSLDPGQSQVVSFTVMVPQGARPGQHVGGIVAENLAIEQGTPTNGVQINIQHQTIMAVQVNLPGALVERLEASKIAAGGSGGYQTLDLTLRNSGTQMLKPNGTLQVFDGGGARVQNLPITMDTLLPQTAIAYPVYVRGQALGEGTYTAQLTLRYGANNAQLLRYSTTFVVTSADIQQVFGGMPRPAPPAIILGGSSSWLIAAVAALAALLAAGGMALALSLRLRARVPLRAKA